MSRKSEKGFSLVELLCVVVIIGVITALAIPSLRRATIAAENGSTFGTLRSVSSTQMSFFASNNRFGRLDEINPIMGNGIGKVSGSQLIRGKYFVFEMTPSVPSDIELKDGYIIKATRNVATDGIYQFEMTQSGEIRQIFP